MLSRRSGISSIMGSIFFILIAFLVLSTSVLVFNNFSQYATTLKKSNQADTQVLETSLQFKRVIFGGITQPTLSQTFNSVKNTQSFPFFPISNMNFTQNMNGWYFTRLYVFSPPDTATVSNSPLYSVPGTVIFTLTVQNSRMSKNDIAQVSLTADSRFSVASTQPSPSGWSSTVSGNTITWTANLGNNGKYEPNDIDGGESLTFTWTATVTSTGTYYHTVTLFWVSHDVPPFVDSGSGTITTVVGSTTGSKASTNVVGNQVPGAGGANGGYDPSTPIGSESGPGSLYLFFEPTIGGLPINQSQQLGSIMNFTTSFTLDTQTASSIAGASFSYGYSVDNFVCNGDQNECSVTTSTYLIQESTGKEYTLASFNPTQVGQKNPSSVPTGWIFISNVQMPSITWSAGKYDIIVSTRVMLQGSNPGSENYPALLYMHFDDVGIALKLVSSSYYVDSWAQSQAFVIQTNTNPLNITGIRIDVVLGTNSGPVYVYAYLNDFSRGTLLNPAWTLMNSTVFSQTADIQINVPSSQTRLYVDAQGNIALRIYAISLSQFQLNAQVSSILQTADQTKLAVQIINLSPFAVHLVSLYVNGPGGLIHFDINSSAPGVVGPFNIWLSPGQSVSVQLNVNWVSGQIYVFTVVADNGAMATSAFKS